ncbi:MAG TPA: hypothetical protein DIV86_02710 [Alphaproteobacteria bacterium]|nr:hypothetical protein [Alphaproteobacteria bacterium]
MYSGQVAASPYDGGGSSVVVRPLGVASNNVPEFIRDEALLGDESKSLVEVKPFKPQSNKVAGLSSENSRQAVDREISVSQNKIIKRTGSTEKQSFQNYRSVGGMEYYLAEAYKNNPEINAARAQLKAADEALPQAYSGFLPDLSYNLNNTYTKSGFQNSSTREKFYTNGNSLELRQELFGGGESTYAIKAALDRRDAAESQMKFIEQRFFQEAISAYVNTIFSNKIYDLAKKNEKTLEEQLVSTRQRYVVGDATKTDVAQSESRYATARSNTMQAYNDSVIARSNFKRIFLKEVPSNLQMPTNLPEIPDSLSKAFSNAAKSNPELKRFASEKSQRENEVEQAKAQLYPQIDAVASMSERESVTGTNLFATDQDSVTLNVTIPIYDGGLTYSRVRETQDRRRQAGFAYEGQKNILRDNIERAWQQVEYTTKNIQLSKESLVAAEFAVQGIREEQKEGARLIQDILDAERERFQAEISYARAIRDSVLSIYNLKNTIGELTASELNLPVANYDTKEHFEKTKFKFFGY